MFSFLQEKSFHMEPICLEMEIAVPSNINYSGTRDQIFIIKVSLESAVPALLL